ncbi:hypothetical protein BaRGS_00030579, partial [Batillaria attramentaria]
RQSLSRPSTHRAASGSSAIRPDDFADRQREVVEFELQKCAGILGLRAEYTD